MRIPWLLRGVWEEDEVGRGRIMLIMTDPRQNSPGTIGNRTLGSVSVRWNTRIVPRSA